jgi:Gamma tubulin complex component C-terminal
LQYGDIGGLERSIDTAYQIASHRLFEVFIEKFKLLDHLLALKHFLLLSHGDFADQLMQTLGYCPFVYTCAQILLLTLLLVRVWPSQPTLYTATI